MIREYRAHRRATDGQLTEADGSERRALHGGAMLLQRIPLCHLPNLQGEKKS